MPTRTLYNGVKAHVFRRLLSGGDDSPLGSTTDFPVSSTANGTITTTDSSHDWKRRIRERVSATTSMSVQVYKIEQHHDGFAERKYRRKSNGKVAFHVQLSGCLGAISNSVASPTSVDQTRVHNLVLGKFIAQATSAKTQLQSLVVAGEFGETAKLIRNLLHAAHGRNFAFLGDLQKIFKSSKRHRTRAKRLNYAKNTVANNYLEYAFGVIPLFNDIQGAALAASKIISNDRLPSLPIRATGRDSGIGLSPIISTNTFGGSLSVTRTYSTTDSFSERLYGAVLVRNNWNGAFASLGLDLASWVPSIYELLPYSFLVDYFTNFGGIVEALAFNRADVAWINKGTSLERTLKLESIELSDPPLGPLSNFYGEVRVLHPGTPFSVTRRSLSREPFTGSLIPSLEFRIPGLGMKWLNMAALIAQGRSTSNLIGRYVN
jgi:hypothetical protein